MRKAALVARYEFWRHVTRRGFLFAVFGIPIIFALIFGAVIWYFSGRAREPIGVVDHSHSLLDPAAFDAYDLNTAPIRNFADEGAARAALERNEIQGYFVVPADYLEINRVTLYYLDTPSQTIQRDFRRYLRASALSGEEAAVARRFAGQPADVVFISLTEEKGRGNPITFILPYFIGLLFVVAIFTTAGYLLQAVVDEKENRTMEILITSISPEQLMVGKIVGLVGVGLVQILIWASGVALAFLIARANIPQLEVIEIPRSTLLIAIAWFAPFYLLIASLMVAIGISVSAVSEGQQAAGIVSLISMAPLWLVFIFIESPDSQLAVVLSLFPFSSPLSILIRWQVTEVSTWQLVLSWFLLAGTAVLAMFLVSRLLRVGMLRYGQRLTLRDVARVVLPKVSDRRPEIRQV